MPDERHAHLQGDHQALLGVCRLLPLGAAERPGLGRARAAGAASPLDRTVQLIRCRCCSLVGLLRELQLFWGIPGPEHIGDVVAAMRGGCAQFRLQFLCQGLDFGGWMATGEPQQLTGNVAKAQLTQPNRRSQGPASSCEAVHAPLFST